MTMIDQAAELRRLVFTQPSRRPPRCGPRMLVVSGRPAGRRRDDDGDQSGGGPGYRCTARRAGRRRSVSRRCGCSVRPAPALISATCWPAEEHSRGSAARSRRDAILAGQRDSGSPRAAQRPFDFSGCCGRCARWSRMLIGLSSMPDISRRADGPTLVDRRAQCYWSRRPMRPP